jgi:hypothetical protein
MFTGFINQLDKTLLIDQGGSPKNGDSLLLKKYPNQTARGTVNTGLASVLGLDPSRVSISMKELAHLTKVSSMV